ncbi:hypothetical protein GQ457_17G014380 [Hibiscus cannabinus]
MFAASFDSKMGFLYSAFDVKKQGKSVWYDFRVYGSVNKQWGGYRYPSPLWDLSIDTGIRVPIPAVWKQFLELLEA